MSLFNLFGAIPDILQGRDPWEALLGNAAAVGGTLAGAGGLQSLTGAGEAAGASSSMFDAVNPYTSPDFIAKAAASSTGGPTGGGLLSQIGSAADTASKYAPMASMAMGAAEKGGLLGGQQAPIQPGQLPQFQQMSMAGDSLEAMKQKRMQRRGLLDQGGGYGFA